MRGPLQTMPNQLLERKTKGNMYQFLSLVLLFQAAFGMFTADFQADGDFSKKDYMEYESNFEPDLRDFTVCARVKVFFLRGQKNFFISYANEVTDDALRASIVAAKSEDGTQTFQIQICKYQYITQECVIQDLPGFSFNQWYHFCAVFTAIDRTITEVGVTVKLFIDGKFNKAESKVIKDGKYVSLTGGGRLIVGQEQDTLGGSFDETQSLSGSVTGLEVWSQVISPEDIQELASCDVETLDISERIVKWTKSEWKTFGNVTTKSPENICQPSPLLNVLIWPRKTSYDEFKGLCDKLGGKLPIITDNGVTSETLTSLVTASYAKLQALEQDYIDGNCNLGVNTSIIWLRQRKVDNLWTDPYDSTTSFKNFDIIDSHEKCAYIFGNRIEPAACLQNYACGVCQLPPGKLLKMKGLCREDIMEKFDTDYYIFGAKNSLPHFRGTKKSHIFFDADTKQWTLQSLKDPKNFVTAAKLPLGTAEWRVSNDNVLCGLKTNGTKELTMSLCYPLMYTCNSGHCIPLSDKCDTDIDCDDKSDEFYCDYLRLKDNYAKTLLPRDRLGNPLDVHINVSILAFPSIDTVNLKFTADFFLQLRWYDLRIEFRDLNNVTSLNSLSYENCQSIWTPKIGFTNALGPYQTTVDDLTSGVLVKEATPLSEDITLSTEAMLFSGKDNAIFFSREYYQDYGCSFDLRFYPFDTQMCEMIFEIQGKTDNYVRFIKDGEGIEFRTNKKLVEYEIQMVALFTTSEQNISRAMARVVFRRRMEFHVTNTFLQTFTLVCVGYLSLYFDVDNFTDRIMVTLTTMLVIATVSSSVSSNLPKTAYYKMVDYWLGFSLNMLVMIMAFHTYLASRVAQAKEEPFNFMTENSFFFKKSSKVSCACQPANYINPTEIYNPLRETKQELSENNTADLRGPQKLNLCGKIIFVLLVLGFNGGFWYFSIKEYVRPASEYINAPSNSSSD